MDHRIKNYCKIVFPNRYNIETYHDYLLLRKTGDFNSPEYEPVKMFSSEMMNEREKEILIYFNGFQCDKCKYRLFD